MDFVLLSMDVLLIGAFVIWSAMMISGGRK